MTPVTVPLVGPAGVGTVTTKALGVPMVTYSVDVPVTLLPNQKGLDDVVAMPQGLIKFGSS